MPLSANELAGYHYPVPTGLLHAAQPQIPFLRDSYMLHSPKSRSYGTFACYTAPNLVPTGLLHATQPQIPFLRDFCMLHSPKSRSYGTFTHAKTAHVAYLKARLSLLAYVCEGAFGGCESMLCMVWKGVLHDVEGCSA